MKCINFALLLLAFVAFVGSANAADCELDGQKANTGEEFFIPGECSIYTCTGKGSFNAKTCPEFVAPANCKIIPQDNSKPWPDCCKSSEC